MKSEDKMKIVSSNVSVLESTRKDFETLIGSANSSNEDGIRTKEIKPTKVRKHRLKKHGKHRTGKESMELVELNPVSNKPDLQHDMGKFSSSHTNPTFWYEDENDSSAVSSKSSMCSTNSETLRHEPSQKETSSPSNGQPTSAKQAEVMIHKNPSLIQNSSDDEDSGDEPNKSASVINSKSSPSVSLPQSLISSKKKNKRRKLSSQILDKEEISGQSTNLQESEKNSIGDETKNTSPLAGQASKLKLVVHRSDRLILDHSKTQPLVIVHVVSRKTCRYIVNNGIPIPPQFTGAPIQKTPSTHPEWNQEMFFEFDVGKFLSEVVFLFEIVSEPNATVSSQLAWGFLRPVSKTGVFHVDKRMQLQLFKVPAGRLFQTLKPNISDLYSWFCSAQKEKYPACLYITLLRISSFTSQQPTGGKFLAMTKNPSLKVSSPIRGSRLSGQPFKLPTRLSFSFSSTAGALIASYSSDGILLAVALTNGDIYIYENLTESCQLKGHIGNVYDLHWDSDCRENSWQLLSCGTDCTARVWNQSDSVILPHPAFVYCARFGQFSRIVTGCFDQSIRLWDYSSATPHLINTYVQHAAPINSLCWDSQERLYSADANGCICIWTCESSGLRYEKILNESSDEYRNQTPVNCLSFHPSGAKLFVHYRGSNLCLLEPKSGMKLMSFSGIYNPRLRLTSSISPCGSFVVSGSEDGSVHWFDLERGDLVAISALPTSSTPHPVMAIAFHPVDHVLALCSLNTEHCLAVLEFDKADTKIQGFSMTTFPRTVQSALSPIENISRGIDITQQNKTTTTLDKLERIFRKLDLVMTWSHSHEKDEGTSDDV